jgi:hypothetical protein
MERSTTCSRPRAAIEASEHEWDRCAFGLFALEVGITGGAGWVRRALGARGHAQSAECRSSRISDKAVRHVNAAEGDVPTILLKAPREVSVAEDGTKGPR